MSGDLPSMTVDLARASDFRLGSLAVRPSTREVGQGPERTLLEPRVMQVLVALARRQGEVVSRDELIATCWDGRIVGDDAINACVAKVRRVGEGGRSFAIETVPRVGYRLTAAGSSAQPQPASDEVILAVLPFENLSDDPQLSYFSDGVAEEILNALAQRTDLKVIGRSSSFQFRGVEKAIPNVARLLGATHVLDGAVRRGGARLRISSQLVDCASQTTVWASQFERELSDVFALQDEISVAVAGAMRSALHPAVRSGALDPAVYDLYLQGSSRPGRLGADTVGVRTAQLEEVVRRAPLFADAWGALGQARASLASFLPLAETQAILERARAAALHALALDPRCALAAIALARSTPVDRLREQEVWLAKAQAWAPNDVQVARLYARLMATVGRGRDAMALIRQSHRLDPLEVYTQGMLGRTLFESGEFAEAKAVLTRGMGRWPGSELFPLWLIYTLGMRGELDEARDLLQRTDAGPHRRTLSAFLDLYVARAADAGAQAVAALRQQYEDSGWISLDALVIAAELAGPGEVLDIALGAVVGLGPGDPDPRGAAANDPALLFMPFAPRMRQDRRFVEVCARLGLVDYWLATGKWPDCVAEPGLPYDFRAECRRLADEAPA